MRTGGGGLRASSEPGISSEAVGREEESVMEPSAARSSSRASPTVAEVEATTRDYIEGWYSGDVRRMDRALHDGLVKRTRMADDPSALREVTRTRMLELTADEGGDAAAADMQIAIDGVSADIASVRVISADYVDYLHLARTADGWKIVNVLFHNRG